MAAKGLTDKDMKQLDKEIKLTKDFIKAIEKMGGEVPKPLKNAINRFEIAVNTGKDLAKAADAASKALKEYEKDLYAACKTVDKEQEMVCEAGVFRKWQKRRVTWVLDPKNKKSVISQFIKKTIQRYTPAKICKHWDYCAKEAKKAK